MEKNPYASMLGGGGGAGDKATSSASTATSGNQFGGIGGDAAGSPLVLLGAIGVFILGLVALVWAISRN